ncbi:MAG: hypothetical protein QW778_04945, partial [Candidatus Micrarchaeaceae archaeon]
MANSRDWTLFTTYNAIVNILYAFVLISPLYIFKGDINGYVGFIGYDLIAFGEQFYSASLDSVKNFTFFLLLQTVFNIV